MPTWKAFSFLVCLLLSMFSMFLISHRSPILANSACTVHLRSLTSIAFSSHINDIHSIGCRAHSPPWKQKWRYLRTQKWANRKESEMFNRITKTGNKIGYRIDKVFAHLPNVLVRLLCIRIITNCYVAEENNHLQSENRRTWGRWKIIPQLNRTWHNQ